MFGLNPKDRLVLIEKEPNRDDEESSVNVFGQVVLVSFAKIKLLRSRELVNVCYIMIYIKSEYSN